VSLALATKIRKHMVSAISDYHMLAEGDRLMVAVSGGKDSTIMLLLLDEIRKRAPFAFTLDPVILDQKQPGFDCAAYSDWLQNQGMNLKIISEDTYSIVKDKVPEGKTYCGLCSRLRRGILYNYAADNGYSKIALGHHRDDMNETLLLNMFYVGRIASMPPKLFSDDGRNTIIRPLAYIPEQWLRDYEQELSIPVIPCNLCGSQDQMRRQEMKHLLRDMEQRIPGVQSSLQTAMKNIRASQLLDTKLYDFQG